MAFLLAQTLIAESANKKLSLPTLTEYRTQARALLRELRTARTSSPTAPAG